MEEYPQNIASTVCILAAGKGTRMGSFAKTIHKALLLVDGKALLSHQIESFPANTHFVIALGDKAKQIKDYVSIAHPKSIVTFVDVSPFEGPGSGPGRSLWACKDFLPGPFYFLACDSLWQGRLPNTPNESWLGLANSKNISHYSTAQTKGGFVKSISDKSPSAKETALAFTGIAHFAHPASIWPALERSLELGGPSEIQMLPAIEAILAKGENIRANILSWQDFGSEFLYGEYLKAQGDFDFSKTNESLYFVENRVIKFFVDQKISEHRRLRAQRNPGVFPKILAGIGGFYSYEFLPGKTLYSDLNVKTVNALLRWSDTFLWRDQPVSQSKLEGACQEFYQTKTLERMALLRGHISQMEGISSVNGKLVPPLEELLKKIPWGLLISESKSVFFHGDFQPDNILLHPQREFVLLDWRQDFAGELDFGDIYYDLAKLYGGLKINYGLVRKNEFHFEQNKSELLFSVPTVPDFIELERAIQLYCERTELSWNKVRLLVAIIFCNMAPLHQPPFREALYALARIELATFYESTGAL